MDSEKLKFVTSLLEYPEETAVTEYKSAIAFDSKSEFGAKLVKHILGHANTGGGYIVIGFQEHKNGKLLAGPALTEDVSRSYETTRLSQSVDSFLSPGMMHWHRESQEDALGWSKTVPLGSIEAALGDLTREATRELFMLFEYWEPTDQVFGEVFNEFSKSNI